MRPDARIARALRTPLATAGLASLTACLIVPTPEVSEIRDSRLEFIQPGITTRQELEAELTSRDVFAARTYGPYAVYAEYRSSFGIVVFAPGAGDGPDYGNVDDYLVVEYDDANRVIGYERLHQEDDCTSYGLCVRGGSERNRDEDSRKDPNSLVVFAPPVDDEALKMFEPIAGACSVYAYTSGRSRCESENVDIHNLIAGVSRRPTRTDPEGYFHWSVPVQGPSTLAGSLIMDAVDGADYDHRYECAAGQTLFVEAYVTNCGQDGLVWVEFFEPPREEAERELSRRRLMLQ